MLPVLWLLLMLLLVELSYLVFVAVFFLVVNLLFVWSCQFNWRLSCLVRFKMS